MGEQENIELMREAYERWNATGRLPLEQFHPEIEWHTPVGDHDVAYGHDEVVAEMGDIFQSFEYLRNVPERIEARGDLVVVVVNTRTRGRGSGVELANRAAHVWTVRDELAVRFEVYEDIDEGLRLVGR